MIGYVSGTLAEIMPGCAIVDAGGVGYEVLVSNDTASRLYAAGTGTPVRLYTYTYVREDAFLLYGFLSRDELALYKQLLTVSGVGPKGALSLLSGLRADDLRFAIITGDTKSIAAAQGIGKKTAERLVLELRDKLGKDDTAGDTAFAADAAMPQGAADQASSDTIEALTALGYPRPAAIHAAQRAREEIAAKQAEDLETEQLLKAALKYL